MSKSNKQQKSKPAKKCKETSIAPAATPNFECVNFNVPGGRWITITAAGTRSILSFSKVGKKTRANKFEWFENYADALRRMAAVLDGEVSYEEFGSKVFEGRPELDGRFVHQEGNA